MARLFLGLDCSTQSLSACIIDYDLKKVVYERSLNFDRDLSHYGTHYGCLPNSNSLLKHSPPLMWVEGIDNLFLLMKQDGISLNDILAISGSAQQHGSVYLNSTGISRLRDLNPSKTLLQNFKGCFSRETSPIWMDTSTSEECREILSKFNSHQEIIELTGSNLFERFTGPQIRKFFKKEPAAFDQTICITLISSFMAAIITGKPVPIDFCDASGMNLMDIRQKKWDHNMLEATAPGLLKRLPSLTHPWDALGNVSSYFIDKYGFNKNALSISWSGDNHNSLIGLGVIKEGIAAISLGTSFTYFGFMEKYQVDPKGESHLFVGPTGDYMPLICFKNGALAIEKMRAHYSLEWDSFNQALVDTPTGNDGRFLLPYYESEIVPKIENPGIHRFNLKSDDVSGNCRALIEGQMMSMRIHSEWVNKNPNQIYVTGGVSVNQHIVQIMADIFNCNITQLSVSNSASLGAALRAAHGYFMHKGIDFSWSEIVSGFTDSLFKSTIKPSSKNVYVYEKLIENYAHFQSSNRFSSHS